MDIRPKIRNAVLAAVFAAVGATSSIADNSVAQPDITVEGQRLTEDARIQAAVMDRIANMPNISGKIGVESKDGVVRLSGFTATAGQAWRAGREARGVAGVRYVQNEIRAKVGVTA